MLASTKALAMFTLVLAVAASAFAQVRPRAPQSTRAVARRYVEFRGQFDSLPVRVAGRDADELYMECLDLVRASGLTSAREVWIDGHRVTRRQGELDMHAACAIGVLNAVPASGQSAPIVLAGAIDGIPFALAGTIEDARATLHHYVPIATRDTHISRLTINGRVYVDPRGWSTGEVVAWMDDALAGARATCVTDDHG